jgi:hypothetical protein
MGSQRREPCWSRHAATHSRCQNRSGSNLVGISTARSRWRRAECGRRVCGSLSAPSPVGIPTRRVRSVCARAASGHPAAPPRSVINCRRLMLVRGAGTPARVPAWFADLPAHLYCRHLAMLPRTAGQLRSGAEAALPGERAVEVAYGKKAAPTSGLAASERRRAAITGRTTCVIAIWLVQPCLRLRCR